MSSRSKLEIYHKTMGMAIDAAKDDATSRGFDVADEPENEMWNPMQYENYQTRLYRITKDGKPVRKALNISLYRMRSGTY